MAATATSRPAESETPRPPARATKVTAQRPPLARPRGAVASSARPGGARQRQNSASSAEESDGGPVSLPGGIRRAQALHEFITCVEEDFLSVVAAFQAQGTDDTGFAAFKALWLSSRMSAMFHVEFWDSSPTDTHHAILQVALELLLRAVRDVDRREESQAIFVRVLGHLFALYSAFCVQVSEPKVKIAIDPTAWQMLARLSALLSRISIAPPLTQAAHEAVAILRRLEHEERAFMKCFGGSVVEFQLGPVTSQEQPGAEHDGPVAEAIVPRRNQHETNEMLLRIQALSVHYNTSLQNLVQDRRKAEDSFGSAATKRGSTGRNEPSQAKPTFLRQSRLASRTANAERAKVDAMVEGLWSYSRESATEVWHMRLQRSFDLSRAPRTTASCSLSTTAAIVPSNLSDSSLFGDGTSSDVDAALLSLEQELVCDGDQEHTIHEQRHKVVQSLASANQQNSLPKSSPRQLTNSFSGAMSNFSSGQESDGLDELEAELQSTVQPTASRSTRGAFDASRVHRGMAVPGANTMGSVVRHGVRSMRLTQLSKEDEPLRSKRPDSALLGTKDNIAEVDLELERCREQAKSVATGSRVSQIHLQSPSIVSIDTESDGLAELEAELSREVETINGRVSLSKQTAPAKRRHDNFTGKSNVKKGSSHHLGQPPDGAGHPRRQPHISQTTLRVNGGLMVMDHASREVESQSSDVEGVSELDLLQKELNAGVAEHQESNSDKRSKVLTNRHLPVGDPCAPQQKKRRLEDTDVTPHQILRRSRRLSVASSARTDSDSELAALQAELSSVPAQITSSQSTLTHRVSNKAQQSSFSEYTQSDDELKQLEEELTINVGTSSKQAIVRNYTKANAKVANNQPKRASKPRKETAPRLPRSVKSRQPRKLGHGVVKKTPSGVEERFGPIAAVSSARVTPPTSSTGQHLSSRQSVASSYDSDGLDELERELNALSGFKGTLHPRNLDTNTMMKGALKSGASTAPTNLSDGGDEDTVDEGWRVLLLRALICGDVNREGPPACVSMDASNNHLLSIVLERAMEDHIEVLSLPFIKSMPEWKVQWESLHWWMLRDGTPLFIAAAYSHPELVNWLLLRGADREFRCYLRRSPLDFVGECSEANMRMTATSQIDNVSNRSDACRRLLTAPASTPAPPMANVHFCSQASTQVVILKADPLSSTSSTATRRGTKLGGSGPPQQTVFKCLLEILWDVPLSNGALIEKYEVRYRLLAEEGEGGDGTAVESWRTERVIHNRKVKVQRLLVENLLFDSTYDFMLRSCNVAGKGDWGRVHKIRTLATPEQAISSRISLQLRGF